jgi:hypothetical protein
LYKLKNKLGQTDPIWQKKISTSGRLIKKLEKIIFILK